MAVHGLQVGSPLNWTELYHTKLKASLPCKTSDFR